MSTKLSGGLNTNMVFAIYGSASEFGPENTPNQLTGKTIKPKYEGRALYELFKGAGIRIFPVSKDLAKIGTDRTYRSLSELPEPVDVLIDCLAKEHAVNVVQEAAGAGIKCLFFQPNTASPEGLKLCQEKGIESLKGCLVRHWSPKGLPRFISPCYYMGLGANRLRVG